MEIVTIKEFYKDVFESSIKELDTILSEINMTDNGHFNVFNIKDFYKSGACGNGRMPYI